MSHCRANISRWSQARPVSFISAEAAHSLTQKKEAHMSIVNVKQVSHVALKTQNVERQAAFYTNMVGLGETQRDSVGRIYLRCNANHHALVLVPAQGNGIDHYALDVGDAAALEAAATALARAGIAYESEENSELGQGTSLRLRDPDGYVVELIGGMEQVAPTYGPRAVQPRKLGHVTLLVGDGKSRD